MTVTCLVVDTSYLTELFKVPNASDPEASLEVRRRFKEAARQRHRLFVPLPCIFELGTHIADEENGRTRRNLAKTVMKSIETSINEEFPWTIIPSVEMDELVDLWKYFQQDFVKQGVDLTDAFTIQEAHRLKKKYRSFDYKVHIWTKDGPLKSYEPDKEPSPYPPRG